MSVLAIIMYNTKKKIISLNIIYKLNAEVLDQEFCELNSMIANHVTENCIGNGAKFSNCLNNEVSIYIYFMKNFINI